MVAEHPNELVRDQYLVTVSDRTRLDPERLRPRLEALVKAFEASGRKTAGEAAKTAANGQSSPSDEEPPWDPEPNRAAGGPVSGAGRPGAPPARGAPLVTRRQASVRAGTLSCLPSTSPRQWQGG